MKLTMRFGWPAKEPVTPRDPRPTPVERLDKAVAYVLVFQGEHEKGKPTGGPPPPLTA